MTDIQIPSPETLRKLLRYEHETGKLFWRERCASFFKDGVRTAEHNCSAWNARYSGKEAFTATGPDKYFRGGIFYRNYLAHRIIWAMKTGAWPKDQIDHKNHIRTDNRISNLREVTNQMNHRNMPMQSSNISGHTGVCWSKSNKKWQATIGIGNKTEHLGHFDNMQDAISARSKANVKYGYHINHGKLAQPSAGL